MQKVFDDGLDLYTTAADAYYNGFKKLGMPYAEVRKRYRGAFKQGVISSIYTAGDVTLATGYDVPVHEVREINKAIFDKFQVLYQWQQNQISWNKQNRNRIRTYLGDIRTTYEDAARQTRQAVNLDVQGTCSLIATTSFNNLLTTANAKRMYLAPAVIVHDAIIAYAKAYDIEKIYDHYTENFLKFAGNNYGFWFPFDIDINKMVS
jgi:DNA polymerase I-like protein with 3'-5' exonuclease and polymerase domains